MQGQTSTRAPDTSMTAPLACRFSAASKDTSISTGKERDAESGNDYFGARYYASSMGRFMSPDWAAKAEPVPYAKLDNPQTLNLYAYMRNNPLGGVDPDGHCDWCQKAWNRVVHGEAKTDQERAQQGVNNDIVLVRSKVKTEEKTGYTIVEWTPVGAKNIKDGKLQGGLPSPDPNNHVVLWESKGGSSYELKGESMVPGIGHDTISSGKGGMYPPDVDQRWSVNGKRVQMLVGFDDAGKPILAWQIHYDRSGDTSKMTTK